MKIKYILLIFVLFLITLFAYNSNITKYKDDISAKDAYEMMQKEDIVFIDVRTKKEFYNHHAKGAISIPIFLDKDGKRVFNENFIKNVKTLTNNQLDKKIILICRSGSRSKYAANLLAQNGFSNVYNILNGTDASGGWSSLNLPMIK